MLGCGPWVWVPVLGTLYSVDISGIFSISICKIGGGYKAILATPFFFPHTIIPYLLGTMAGIFTR
jgi:hypothetical protein